MKLSHTAIAGFRCKPETLINSLSHILRSYPSLRQYAGVCQNYVEWSLRTLDSEGKQAQSRLKSYREYFQSSLSRQAINIPDDGSYRKLLPILRIAQGLLEIGDVKALRILDTVLRISEIARPSKRFIASEIRDFVQNPDLVEIEPYDLETVNQPAKVYLTYGMLRDDFITKHPDFPYREWEEFVRSEMPALSTLARVLSATPHFEATKASGSSSSLIKNSKGKFKKTKSIVEGDIVEVLTHTVWDNPPVWEDFANSWLQYAPPKESAIAKFDSKLVKDEHLARELSPTVIRFHRAALVGIEASLGVKARLVHEGSYPIQYALEPLADTLTAILRYLPECYAHDHEGGFEEARRLAKKHGYCKATDATAWTDYFPLYLIATVMSAVFAELGRVDDEINSLTSMWIGLMRVSEYVRYTDDDGNPVECQIHLVTGTSMGIRTGWLGATLTHCMLFRFACHLLDIMPQSIDKRFGIRIRNYGLFNVIGDDETCYHRRLAALYETLSTQAGIKLNPSKSMEADPRSGTYLFEFVHRQALIGGPEITGISILLTGKILTDYANLQSYVSFCYKREQGLGEYFYDMLLDTKNHNVSSRLRREIRLGLRIPVELGGLLPPEEVESKSDPTLCREMMLALVRAFAARLNPNSNVSRTGRYLDNELLAAVGATYTDEMMSFINLSQSSLARFDREQYNNGYRVHRDYYALLSRTVKQLPEILKTDYQPDELDTTYVGQLIRDFKSWKTSLTSTADLPHYMGHDYEIKSVNHAITRLDRVVRKNVYIPDLGLTYRWSDDFNRRLNQAIQQLQDQVNGVKPRPQSRKSTQELYDSLFG